MKRKTLQQHLAQGTFRRDRHEYLLKGGAKPTHMPLREWEALRRMLLGPQGEEEFHGLTRAEFIAHERLLPADALATARERGPEAKRIDIQLGKVNPLVVPPLARDQVGPREDACAE